jgi:hypothetical protein
MFAHCLQVPMRQTMPLEIEGLAHSHTCPVRPKHVWRQEQGLVWPDSRAKLPS